MSYQIGMINIGLESTAYIVSGATLLFMFSKSLQMAYLLDKLKKKQYTIRI